MITSTRIAAGQTSPGQGWKQHQNEGVYLDVDTTAAKFSTTPTYVITLSGPGGNMWFSGGGASSVYDPTPTGFRVYLRRSDSAALPVQTVTDSYKWYVNWIGIEGVGGEAGEKDTCYDPNIPTDFTKIIAKNSGKALNVKGASKDNGASLIQYGPTANAENELFKFIRLGDGYHRIESKVSGKVLDVTAGADTMSNGAVIRQWDWCNTDNQKFRVEPVGDGYYRIIAKHSLLVLTVLNASTADSGGIIQYEWVTKDNQKWKLS